MNNKKQVLQIAKKISVQKINNNEKTKIEELKKIKQVNDKLGISGEYATRIKLGETGFSEEEIHWVSEMFGK
ncbi:MAG: hypothetical protein IJ566_00300 [Cardiobacteriaceae bacterium]|nr:hypothetical protein [Cardiobacteriaceae bacterium]